MIDFLLNSNMGVCILNDTANDFTSTAVDGNFVVDYCLVNHDDLHMFESFNVLKTTEVISKVGCHYVLISRSYPDHSVLKRNVCRN